MRTLPTAGNAASYRADIGEFEHKNKNLKFKQYQAASTQLGHIAARHPQSTPQRPTLVTALYALSAFQLLTLPPGRGVLASQTSRSTSAGRQARLFDSISSVQALVPTDRELPLVQSGRLTGSRSSNRDGRRQSISRAPSRSASSALLPPQNQVRSSAAIRVESGMPRSRRSAPESAGHELVLRQSDHCAHWQQKDDVGNSEQTDTGQDEAIARLRTSNEAIANLVFDASSEAARNWRSDISLLLEQVMVFSEQGPSSRTTLARHLMDCKGMYGAEVEDQLSVPLQKKVIRDWVVENILGTSIAHYLQKALPEFVHSSSSVLDTKQLFQFLENAILNSKVRFSSGRLWLINHVIFEELPALQYLTHFRNRGDPEFKYFDLMRADEFEWGEIHAGLLFAKHAGLTIAQVSIDEAAELGRAIMLQLELGAAPQAWWALFRLPALIRLAQKCPQEVANLRGYDNFDTGLLVLDGYAKDYQHFLDIHCPILQFERAQQYFNTRPALAEKIISEKCPGLDVETYLNALTPLCPDDHPYLSVILPNAWVPYYPGELKHLPDINHAFQGEIDRLAAIYEKLDKLSMLVLWSEQNSAEIEFQWVAEIKTARPKFVATYMPDQVPAGMGNAMSSVEVNLRDGVEFLHVTQENREEHIYALYKENFTYRLLRVDRDESLYYRFLGGDKRPAVSNHFSLVVEVDSLVLKPPGQPLTSVFEHLAKGHSQDFAKALYDFGYEKTIREEVIDTVLSLRPFFYCGRLIAAHKESEAMMICGLDVASLIPAFVGLGALSSEVADKLISGSMITATYAARRMAARGALHDVLEEAGSNFIRYGFLPAMDMLTTERMRTLGTLMLRALDPGVELIGAIGASTVRQSMRLLSSLKDNLPRLGDVSLLLRKAFQALPDKVFPDVYEYAHLPGLDKEIAVARLGGRYYGGRPVYARIHPATGQKFGRLYSLSKEGRLDPVPVPVGQRLSLVLEQGLGGLGSKEQGSRWAQHLSARLLRQVQGALVSRSSSLYDLAVHYRINRHALLRCISVDGTLTVQGEEIIDAAEASSSRIADLPSEKVMLHFPSISPDAAVASALRCQDGEILSNEQERYTYDIDSNVFFEAHPTGSSYAYTVNAGSTRLSGVTFEQTRDIARLSSLDQRSAVLRALDIDLNLAELTKFRWQRAPSLVKIPKIIRYVWVGDKPLNEITLAKIEKCVSKAVEKEYSVAFYLSSKAKEANFHKLSEIMSSAEATSSECLMMKKARLFMLEETAFYQKFSDSKNFAQYLDAIDGNGGRATNFASAADILRFALIKEHGGLYLDVDDELTEQFAPAVLEVEQNHFALGGLMRSDTLDMYYEFGTGFWGTYKNNPVIDDILDEMALRYKDPEYQDFYKNRPSPGDQSAMLAYQRRLFYLTGPGVFNTVLRATFPEVRAFIELEKLKAIVTDPETSEIITEIAENLPAKNHISPLVQGYKPGSMHSWKTHRA
jgi:hypothetical protein